MADLKKHANNISTTLNGNITSLDTSITVTDATGMPSISGSEFFALTITDGSNTEIVYVTDDTSSPTFTVTRGQEGTSGTAFSNGDTVELRVTADDVDRKTGRTQDEVVTGNWTFQTGTTTTINDMLAGSGSTHNYGAASSFELPNNASPTVNADGEIAVDTSVIDFSHGIVKYYSGEEMGVVALPVAQFTSPTDGYVISYNGTNNEFELSAAGGGGINNVVEDTTPQLGGNLDAQANVIYWTGGSGSNYHIGAAGGTPFIMGPDTNHKIQTNNDGFTISYGSGQSAQFKDSGSIILTGTDINMNSGDISGVGKLTSGNYSQLTIATGAVTAITSFHSIDTELGASTDDLDTINGGVTGMRLVITASNDARTVVVKDGTGNIQCAGDFSLDNSQDTMELIYNGTAWLELSRSNNGV